MRYAMIGLILLISGCVGIPEGITPINNFNIDRYAGTWYEVARLDHSFERDLEQVSAEYSMRSDGGVKVINRGYDTDAQEWKEAEGKAYFVDAEEIGHLKVSFFGPFYGSYIVFELGEDEQYAFVTSTDRSYLWFLSRTKEIDGSLKQHFIDTVTELGFDTESIIFVNQKTNNEQTSQKSMSGE